MLIFFRLDVPFLDTRQEQHDDASPYGRSQTIMARSTACSPAHAHLFAVTYAAGVCAAARRVQACLRCERACALSAQWAPGPHNACPVPSWLIAYRFVKAPGSMIQIAGRFSRHGGSACTCARASHTSNTRRTESPMRGACVAFHGRGCSYWRPFFQRCITFVQAICAQRAAKCRGRKCDVGLTVPRVA